MARVAKVARVARVAKVANVARVAQWERIFREVVFTHFAST